MFCLIPPLDQVNQARSLRAFCTTATKLKMISSSPDRKIFRLRAEFLPLKLYEKMQPENPWIIQFLMSQLQDQILFVPSQFGPVTFNLDFCFPLLILLNFPGCYDQPGRVWFFSHWFSTVLKNKSPVGIIHLTRLCQINSINYSIKSDAYAP